MVTVPFLTGKPDALKTDPETFMGSLEKYTRFSVLTDDFIQPLGQFGANIGWTNNEFRNIIIMKHIPIVSTSIFDLAELSDKLKQGTSIRSLLLATGKMDTVHE
jgi:hypothetical protein